MSTETVSPVVDIDNSTDLQPATETLTSEALPAINESEILSAVSTSLEENAFNATPGNTRNIENVLYSEYSVFETFIIIEIVMTTVELIISVLAAIKMQRWRRNYRNQMLMQLTIARFIKRIILTFKFLENNGKIATTYLTVNVLNGCQFYIDFVIVILVFFFIKHMYNTLIIVLVKISQNNLYRVLICSWLIPVALSAAWSIIIITDTMDKWHVYLVICTVFRWPLIFLGTGMYMTIVYRVLSDKIRHFAQSLTVVTFLLCLTINVYLFSKDIIELWCLKSLTTLLISYVSGLLMNFLILILYLILLWLTYNNKTQLPRSLPDYSLADVNNKC